MAEEIVEQRAPFQEFGVSGLNQWGGSVYEERLKELRGSKGRVLLREMRLNDPVIAAVFLALESYIKRADWRIDPASSLPQDKRAAEFLEGCLFQDMSLSWTDTMTFILTMFEQGFSVLELVYKRRLGSHPSDYTENPSPSRFDDGRIGWRKWAPRPAESLAPGSEWVFDRTGGIQGINQQPQVGYIASGNIFIPIQKMLLFRTTVAPANNPEGLPIHRSMYLPWWYSTQMMEIEGIGVERDLAGVPIVYLGYDCSLSGKDSDYERAKDLVVNLRRDEQAGIVVPKPKLGTAGDGRGMLVELLSTSGTRGHDTNAIIERYDKRKALALLAQFIMLGLERIGSYALANQQAELFLTTVKAWLGAVADTINRHAIPRLFRYNVFPGITGLPKLAPTVTNVPDLTSLASFINTLVGNEILSPDIDLERHLRQIAGLPPPIIQPISVGTKQPGRVAVSPVGETIGTPTQPAPWLGAPPSGSPAIPGAPAVPSGSPPTLPTR